jgi:hypothetical protein
MTESTRDDPAEYRSYDDIVSGLLGPHRPRRCPARARAHPTGIGEIHRITDSFDNIGIGSDLDGFIKPTMSGIESAPDLRKLDAMIRNGPHGAHADQILFETPMASSNRRCADARADRDRRSYRPPRQARRITSTTTAMTSAMMAMVRVFMPRTVPALGAISPSGRPGGGAS